MQDLAQRLVALYSLDLPEEKKRQEKAETIEQFQIEFGEHYDERYVGESYREAASMKLNNAYLSLFALYEEVDGRLQRLLEQAGGIKQMVGLLKTGLDENKESPWSIVDKLLIEHTPRLD